MSATEALLDAVVTRLTARFATPPRPAICKWPQDPKAKPQFAAGSAAFWVGYNGARAQAPELIDHPVQKRDRHILVSVFARSLHGVHGAADYVDAVHEVLHGWKPRDGSRLVLVEDRFGAGTEGLWRYDLIYSSACLAIPRLDSDDDPPGPALRRVTLADATGGDTEVQSQTPPTEP